MNNFSRLHGTETAPSWLVPGPGVIRAGGQWPKVWSQTEDMGSGQTGLHMKDMSHTISRNWVALGGAALQDQQSLKMSKRQIQKLDNVVITLICLNFKHTFSLLSTTHITQNLFYLNVLVC